MDLLANALFFRPIIISGVAIIKLLVIGIVIPYLAISIAVEFFQKTGQQNKFMEKKLAVFLQPTTSKIIHTILFALALLLIFVLIVPVLFISCPPGFGNICKIDDTSLTFGIYLMRLQAHESRLSPIVHVFETPILTFFILLTLIPYPLACILEKISAKVKQTKKHPKRV